MGGRFEALQGLRVSVVGADCEVRAGSVAGSSNAVVFVGLGEDLEVGSARRGARVVVGVEGGFLAPRRQESVSGYPVQKDDVLAVGDPAGSGAGSERPRLAAPPGSVAEGPIRVLAGPQAALGLDALLEQALEVSPQANRVGIRLSPALKPHSVELPSEPAAWGNVQLTPSGQAIILGPDGPTVGGYPKIAAVIDADLDRLAQLVPGQAVSFKWVSTHEAQDLAEARADRIRKMESELRGAARNA